MEKILFVDPNKCTGCRICETVCSLRCAGVSSPIRSRIRILKWEFEGFNVPIVCQQCEKPLCEKVCPIRAIRIDPKLGIPLVDEKTCIGCRMCMLICPIGAISIDPVSKVAMKCNLCEGDPHCVKYCPADALKYVKYERASILKMRRSFQKMSELLSLILKEGA